MRTHIGKSMKTRCNAIQRALVAYNAAAAALTPPRPPLDWANVKGYELLEEFTLLQDTRNDIRDKAWTKPTVREAMKMQHRIARAREEIIRLNVEVRRLHTAIRDEDALFAATLSRLKETDHILYPAMYDFIIRRQGINKHLLYYVHQIYSLQGFTGIAGPGVRLGSVATSLPMDVDLPAPVPSNVNDEDDHDILDSDEQQRELGNLVQFYADLSL